MSGGVSYTFHIGEAAVLPGELGRSSSFSMGNHLYEWNCEMCQVRKPRVPQFVKWNVILIGWAIFLNETDRDLEVFVVLKCSRNHNRWLHHTVEKHRKKNRWTKTRFPFFSMMCTEFTPFWNLIAITSPSQQSLWNLSTRPGLRFSGLFQKVSDVFKFRLPKGGFLENCWFSRRAIGHSFIINVLLIPFWSWFYLRNNLVKLQNDKGYQHTGSEKENHSFFFVLMKWKSHLLRFIRNLRANLCKTVIACTCISPFHKGHRLFFLKIAVLPSKKENHIYTTNIAHWIAFDCFECKIPMVNGPFVLFQGGQSG
jgi:hypothetical protein